MKYKVLAIDIDGTLVSKNNRISTQNVSALKKYTELGGTVVFVTGRSLTSSLKIAQQLKRKSGYLVPYICCLNSTIIYDTKKQQMIHESLVDLKDVSDIFTYVKNNKMAFGAYTKSTNTNDAMPIYGYGYLPNFLSLFKKSDATKIYKWTNKDHLEPAYKINILIKKASDKNVALINQLKEKYKGKLEVIHTSKYLAEITAANIDKAFGVNYISQLLNIPLSEFAAIGDSANDIPMFKSCALRIAARKKNPVIFEHVDHIVDVKQKNAVANAINEYILKA